MIDFLRANPFVTKEEYMWEWTVPQIKLASYDFSHVSYGSSKKNPKANAKTINSAEDLLNDLGVPLSVLEKEDNK